MKEYVISLDAKNKYMFTIMGSVCSSVCRFYTCYTVYCMVTYIASVIFKVANIGHKYKGANKLYIYNTGIKMYLFVVHM